MIDTCILPRDMFDTCMTHVAAHAHLETAYAHSDKNLNCRNKQTVMQYHGFQNIITNRPDIDLLVR